MQIIRAADFGIVPNTEIAENLIKLFAHAKATDGEKTVLFDAGTYSIDSAKCEQKMLYITNTVGDEEFEDGETPHKNAVPFYLEGISDLTVDGGGAVFVIDGKVTNIAVENCKNITLENMEIRHSHPDMHELQVVSKRLFHIDFAIDRDTHYTVENGNLYFYGKDYRVRADKNAVNAWWIGLIRKATPDKVKRVHHPLFGVRKAADLGNGKVRAHFLNTARFKIGDCFYIYDVRRQFAGIFANRSENVTLRNIKQRFNYSLAFVAQDCENITAESVDFAPEQGSARKLASVADFMQICMCRGKVRVTDSYFDGAGDDTLNVHGIHFKITKKEGNTLTVRFMHPQSHGFNPLRVGDTLAFIDPHTLLEDGQTNIVQSELVNEYEICLQVENAEKAVVGAVVEDISACPDLEFCNNKMTRIITRGLLITTRGKVTVENNRFVSTTMSGILLSDDAKSWYESGMCRDVTIRNNTFDYCGGTPILIWPENSRHAGAVHQNIKIADNVFPHFKGACIRAKSTDGLLVNGNRFDGKCLLQTKDCTDVVSE